MGAIPRKQLKERPQAKEALENLQQFGFPAMFIGPQRMSEIKQRLRIPNNTAETAPSATRRMNRPMK